jgi:hypothetical protein
MSISSARLRPALAGAELSSYGILARACAHFLSIWSFGLKLGANDSPKLAIHSAT